MEQPKWRVYSRFTATREDGKTVKLRIQEMPPDLLDAAVEMHSKYFIKEEPIHRASGVYKSEHARAESAGLVKGGFLKLQAHVDICCVDDDTDTIGELAGVSAMHLTDEGMNLADIQVESPEMKKLLEIAINSLQGCYDVKKEQNVEKFYDDLFILVHPDYRKMGIAKEFLKTRRLVCQLENVPVASSWMSAWGTQKAGDRDGWETVVELSFDEISKRFGVVFDNAPPTHKLMLTRITKKDLLV